MYGYYRPIVEKFWQEYGLEIWLYDRMAHNCCAERLAGHPDGVVVAHRMTVVFPILHT